MLFEQNIWNCTGIKSIRLCLFNPLSVRSGSRESDHFECDWSEHFLFLFCVCVHACRCVCAHVHMHTGVCVCVCVCACTQGCVCVCVSMHTGVCVCECLGMFVRTIIFIRSLCGNKGNNILTISLLLVDGGVIVFSFSFLFSAARQSNTAYCWEKEGNGFLYIHSIC